MLKIFQFSNSLRVCLLLILGFGFNTTLMGNETVNSYYPTTPGSYWVYKNQDGKELTRYAVADEHRDGNAYHAFQYTPKVEEWAFYVYQTHPYLYTVNKNGVASFVRKEGETALKRRLGKQLDIVIPQFKRAIGSKLPEVVLDVTYNLNVEMSDNFLLLPASIGYNKKWDAMKTEITTTLTFEERKKSGKGKPETSVAKKHAVLKETGIIKGTETVKTPAGTFKDCLRIEFENKQVSSRSTKSELASFQMTHPKVLTTLWLAPDVGIVKWEHTPEVSKKSKDFKFAFELTGYEIKSALSSSE